MSSSSDAESKRYIDMWAMPGMHPSNIEFLQKLKSADSNHFTRGMDVVGTVSEQDPKTNKWEKSHLIGVRTDVWKPNKKELAKSLRLAQKRRKKEIREQIKRSGRLSEQQTERLQQQLSEDAVMQMDTGDVEQRRLVLKLFKTTSSRTRWCGTIEEVTTTEVHNSIGSNRALVSFVVMLPRIKLVTYIQQNHRTMRWPSVFSFCHYDEGRMWHVMLQQRWVSAGPDFDIFADGEKIGLQDSKLVGLGSDSYLDIDSHPLADDSAFINIMTLFAASTGYHRAIRRSIRRRVKAIKGGQSHRHFIEDEELRLRHNGRAAA